MTIELLKCLRRPPKYETAQHLTRTIALRPRCVWLTSTGTLVYRSIAVSNGFDPKEKFTEIDYSFTGGIRGTVEGLALRDLSTTYGSNNTQVYVINSANAQLFPALQALSPTPIVPQTNYYNGSFKASEWTSNIDIDNSLTIRLAALWNAASAGQYQA